MATLALTYRYQTHTLSRPAESGPMDELMGHRRERRNLQCCLRPTNHWDLNGTARLRITTTRSRRWARGRLKHYRVHTMYRPKPWATVSGAFNDLERHNNTNNTGTPSLDGPLQHVDHSRSGAWVLALAPNEHYGFDFNYSYRMSISSTNICYLSGARRHCRRILRFTSARRRPPAAARRTCARAC